MLYESTNTGLLNPTMVKDGDKLILVEPAYSTFSEKAQKVFWNVKVQLPDGSHKLAGIMDMVGDEFAKAWGGDTNDWAGRTVIVEIRTAKSTGNPYIVMKPAPDAKIDPATLVSKKEVKAQAEIKPVEKVPYPTEDINPADIPF